MDKMSRNKEVNCEVDGIQAYSRDESLLSPTRLNETSITASTPNRRLQVGVDVAKEGSIDLNLSKSSNDTSEDDEDENTNPQGTEPANNTRWNKDSIPQVKEDMTPWRYAGSTSVDRNSLQYNRSRGSPSKSRLNSMILHTGTQLGPASLGTKPVNFKSLITSQELESLQNQLKKYKIKISALEEVIKDINQSIDLSDPINEKKKLFYDNLLESINTNAMENDNDNNNNNSIIIEDLRKENEQLTHNLKQSHRELDELRKEYNDTLQITDEHLKDYERMDSILTSMLEDLIIVMKNDAHSDRFFDVIPILESTLHQESSFVMSKLVQFQKYWIEVITSKKFQQREFLPIDGPSEDPLDQDSDGDAGNTKDTIENTSLDLALTPQLESVIGQLHKQYGSYMTTLREKLRKSLHLQDEMVNKISEQDKILTKLSLAIVKEKNQNKDTNNITELDALTSSISKLSFKIDGELSSRRTELNETVKDLTTRYQTMLKDSVQHFKITEAEHLRLIKQISKERDGVIEKLESLQDDYYNLQRDNVTFNETRERQFVNLKQSLVLYLTKMVTILEPVLERESIDKSIKKISFIKDSENGLDKILQIQMKVESLLRFNEKALNFLTQSYTSFIVNSPISPSLTLFSTLSSPLSPSMATEQDYRLRIKELERRWATERETRKVEINATEQRINMLELENQKLKQQLQKSNIK